MDPLMYLVVVVITFLVVVSGAVLFSILEVVSKSLDSSSAIICSFLSVLFSSSLLDESGLK
jgi:hypothetical protein